MKTNARLYAGAATGLVLAVAAGFGLAKCTTKPAPPPPADKKVETSAEAKPAADTVSIDAERIRAANIEVQPVSTGGLASEILASATVAAAPDGQAVLTARASGAVTRIFARLGDPVRAGQTIAVVESRDAASIAADRRSAAAKAELASKVLARERFLFDQKVSPRQDLEQAQAEAASARAEQQRAQAAAAAARISADGRSVLVTSPISGRITSATANLGSYVQSEAELFRVADPRRIQVEAALPAADAGRIAPGDRGLIEVVGSAAVEAVVRSVTPGLNADTRSATVVLTVASGMQLTLGSLARVRLMPRNSGSSGGIVVPDEAVQTVDGRDAVFVRTKDGFAARPVTVGARSAGRAEIIRGLQPGAQIAVKNAFLLKAELGKSAEEEE